MKIAPALLLFALASAPLAARAQQSAGEAPTRLELAPSRAPAAAPAPAVPSLNDTEVPLIPETVPQNTKPAEAKPEGKSKTEQQTEDLMERIHFREARIKALQDPQVQAEWDRANKSKTDLQRREALKSYYKVLHARIVKLDPRVKSVSDLREKASLRRLEQTRIDPTEPLLP